MSPAQYLEGEVLPGKKTNSLWTVRKKLEADNDHSNGQFSVGYIVENENGKTAFMKASDISLLFGEDESGDIAGRMLVGLHGSNNCCYRSW